MSDRETVLTEIDDYIGRLFAPEDEALQRTRAEQERGGLPKINVSAVEGKLLHVLALAIGARRILEIGTLGAYSATWLARALPADGRLVSLELNAHHADVGRANLERAGLADRSEVRVGPASETLAAMTAAGEEPFDLVFIDADKDGYVRYLEQVVPLTRSGGLILADNVLSHSALDPHAATGITRFNKALAAREDLTSVIVPIVRHGIDGLAIAVKK